MDANQDVALAGKNAEVAGEAGELILGVVGPLKTHVGQPDLGDAIDLPGARLAVVGRMTIQYSDPRCSMIRRG